MPDFLELNAELTNLQSRISDLSKHFGDNLSGNEQPTTEDVDLIMGFTLLCHAELEQFFEDIASRLADSALDQWNKEHTANYNLAALLLKWELSKLMDSSVADRPKAAVEQYKKTVIKTNNGIKARNLEAVYSPLGYEIEKEMPLLASSLDSYGTKRGAYAHEGHVGISHLPTWADATSDINNLIGLLPAYLQMLQVPYTTS